MREGEGEGIGGVWGGKLGELEEALDHFADGDFLGRAVADDGLFDFARGDFENLQTGFTKGGEGGAAGFTHDEGGLKILREEQAFDSAGGGTMAGDDFAQGAGDMREAAGTFPSGGANNGAVDEGAVGGLSSLDDAIAGAAQGRINADDNTSFACWRAKAGIDCRGGKAPGATGTGLEFLKLFWRYCHG